MPVYNRTVEPLRRALQAIKNLGEPIPVLAYHIIYKLIYIAERCEIHACQTRILVARKYDPSID